MSKMITWDNIRTKKYRNKLLIDVILPPRFYGESSNNASTDDYEYEDDLVKYAIEKIAKTNQQRQYTVANHLDKLYCFVYSWPTKTANGFTTEESDKLLEKFPNINMDKFNNALMGNTCMLLEGETIRYHCDILKALRCGIENRDLHLWEWD